MYRDDHYYNKREWREVRLKVLERDNYTCLWCGYVGGAKISYENGVHALVAHHVHERRFGGVAEIANLITLCMSCHNKIPGQHK